MNAILDLRSVVSATIRLVLAVGFMPSAFWTQAQPPGAFDPSFQASLGGPPDEVLAMVKQTNGQIIVSAFSFIGGYYRFSNINGVPRDGIARLNADGSLDTAFHPSLSSEVDALALQADGKLVIGGGFSQVNGITRNGLARLHADGTLDTSFVTFLPAYVQIRALAIQPDGKVVAAAEYLTHDWNVIYVLRFLLDGSFDPDFTAWPIGSDSPDVNAIVVQPDGRILLGGQFQSVGALARDGLARLNGDGSVDYSFNASTDGSGVSAVALQPDGRILIVGSFEEVNGVPRLGVARLMPDGSVDTGFVANADSWVRAVALQRDGKVLIGGEFTTVNGVRRDDVARLHPDGTVDLTFDTGFGLGYGPDSTVTAMLVQDDGNIVIGGTGFVTYDGFPCVGLARLHGDSALVAPTITQQPASQTIAASGAASFAAAAAGTSPLGYQWQKNQINLANGGHYSGCATATLTITNADSGDTAAYRCVVTNAYGTAASSPAALIVGKNSFGSVTLTNLSTLAGTTTNEARAVTPDGRWVVGVSGTRGFLCAVNTTNVINVVSSDGAQSTLLTGVGYRTNGDQRELILSGLSSGLYTGWRTADGGATWGTMLRGASGKKPTVPAANGLAGAASDVFYSVWTDEGAGATDNWGLNVGRFSGAWPATAAWGSKSAGKPDTLQVNGIASNGRAVGWRRNGTTLVYANYVADSPGGAAPAIWNFSGLDGTTAGQAFSISADATVVFGLSPKGAATGTTNYGYKAAFNSAFPGAATQLSISPLPNFPDTAGSANLAIPYGCTTDGKYAVGMNYRGIEKAVLWDTSNPNPAKWTVLDLTDIAAVNGILDIFTRLSRAYSVGTNAAGNLVIAGVGLDAGNPANQRAFLMTVAPPIAPIAFPPTVTITGHYSAGLTCTFLSLATPGITCYLEYTTNPAAHSAWTTISSTPSTGSMTGLSDPNPPDGQGFYRIRFQ